MPSAPGPPPAGATAWRSQKTEHRLVVDVVFTEIGPPALFQERRHGPELALSLGRRQVRGQPRVEPARQVPGGARDCAVPQRGRRERVQRGDQSAIAEDGDEQLHHRDQAGHAPVAHLESAVGIDESHGFVSGDQSAACGGRRQVTGPADPEVGEGGPERARPRFPHSPEEPLEAGSRRAAPHPPPSRGGPLFRQQRGAGEMAELEQHRLVGSADDPGRENP